MGTTKDIREAVDAELKFDPLVDDADVHVVNVNGDVALNGTVPSYPQYLEAAAAAQRVGGVKNVHNHLEVVLPDTDFRDDAMLTTAANNALALNVTVPDGVEATAQDGNLTLTGAVVYGRQRTRPMAVAGLVGVRNVKDDIDISYDADPVDVTCVRAGSAGPQCAGRRRQRRLRGRQRQHGDAVRARPHLGRTRRGGRRRVDGRRRHAGPRRPRHHRLTSHRGQGVRHDGSPERGHPAGCAG